MNAGKLRHSVQIQAATRTSDGGGGASLAWATISNGTVWADIVPTSGLETFDSEQLQGSTTHKITIRYLAGVTTAHSVLFGTRRFHVREIINVRERNVHMILRAEEEISR